jgi:hypothetical protein
VAAVFGGLVAVAWLHTSQLDASGLRATAPPQADSPEIAVGTAALAEAAALAPMASERAQGGIPADVAQQRLDQGLVGASVPSEESRSELGAPSEADAVLGAPNALESPQRFLDHVSRLDPGQRVHAIDQMARRAVREGRSGALEAALLATRDPRAGELVKHLRQVASEGPASR